MISATKARLIAKENEPNRVSYVLSLVERGIEEHAKAGNFNLTVTFKDYPYDLKTAEQDKLVSQLKEHEFVVIPSFIDVKRITIVW